MVTSLPIPAIVQDAVSKLESKNSSSRKRGFVEVEEDDEKKPSVKKQRKADHSLEKKKKKKIKTTIKKTNLDDQMVGEKETTWTDIKVDFPFQEEK
ncbi:hypothetical protein QYF36_023073 [Acer negundo]|nr:hypothetical protein QYF36_023073 [Acer negundo]